jgi:ankyrin repeat protein
MKTTGIRTAALAALALALAGCTTTKFHPEAVRARMTTLCQQHKFREAREVEAKPYPKGDMNHGKRSPEEAVKEELLETLVNPSEAQYTANRIRTLESQVDAALASGNDKAARAAIYDCGTTPTQQHQVDAIVYLAKCGFLNSRVNPTTLARWERFTAKYVDGAIKAGDFDTAVKAVSRIVPAPAYPERLDDLLGDSADRAVDQLVAPADAAALAGAYTNTLYMLIAPRAGFRDSDYLVPAAEWTALLARLRALQRLDVPTSGFEPVAEPDWRALGRTLDEFRRGLVEDDVSEKDAATIADALFEGFKALAPHGRNGLTTYELNKRILDLKAAAQARVMKALAEERARLLAESLAKRTQELQARLAKLDAAWKNLVAQMAGAIDFSSRETAFTAAISDRVEPAVNRMLGEGARVLRLYRIHGSITPAQATSLLLASIYMGFDDVSNLALAQGADIDGASEKDVDARTPYLLAIQYGFKGSAEKILAKADAARRDANGAGAVHYAVRAGDTDRLLALLGAGADARTPDRDGATPLMLAARLRNPAMATMLLADSDIDATDAKGRAAVHFSTAAADLRTLRALVAAGAATDRTTADGDDLVTLACAANSEEVLAFLLDENKRPVGERSVSWCVIHSKVLPLKTLVAHGGVLTDRHLAAAVTHALPDMVRYLVEQGCDVNSPEVHNAVASLSRATLAQGADFSGLTGWLHGLDAAWIDLAGDETAGIAGLDITAGKEVLSYLYSQGFRPASPNNR